VPAVRSLFRVRTLAPSAVLAVALVATMTAASSGAARPSSVVPVPHSVSAAKPGLVGPTITLASQVSFDGELRAYSLASDKSGTTYVAWISSSVTGSAGRQVHLCTLPLHATGCKGGIQTVDLTDASTSAGLRLLVTPGGAVTIVWYHTSGSGGEIAEATSQAGGPLSAEKDVASAPANGFLLDAELAPDGSIWTVATPDSGSPLEIRAGFTSSPTTLKPPYSVGYAQLAFAGSTPILAITKSSAISQAAAYASRPGGSWTSFKNVAGTGTDGTDVGLVKTPSGVRLVTDIGNAGYTPVVAKWNGHGFAHRTPTGDTCELGAHDAVSDSSGRLADVSSECNKISVSNLADTTHAAIVRFSPGGATAGGQPQIATVPRGFAWVAWSTQYNPASSANGDKLKISQVLLPGLQRHVSHRGAHGSVTLTGPASCLPADTVGVGVKGHAAHGWKVVSHKVTLGHKKLGSSLNGASLSAGKVYSLKGSVVFASGGSHETVSAKLKFRSCPQP
jgi:hypothetical protein